MRTLRAFGPLALLLVAAPAALAQPARVLDGDTLELKTASASASGESTRARGLAGLPARWSPVAVRRRCRRGPGGLGRRRELACVEIDRDRYGRIVATCTVAGRDIGSAMVRQGWALDYERYSGGAYAAE